MTPTDEANAALEEAHKLTHNGIACCALVGESSSEWTDVINAAIDRAVRKALAAAADEARQEYLNAVAADSMSRYDEGHAHGAQRSEQRIRSLISALGLAGPEGRRGENSFGDEPDV